MKVVMTQTASESLWPIYLYHSDYSQDYAEAFQYEIDRGGFTNEVQILYQNRELHGE